VKVRAWSISRRTRSLFRTEPSGLQGDPSVAVVGRRRDGGRAKRFKARRSESSLIVEQGVKPGEAGVVEGLRQGRRRCEGHADRRPRSGRSARHGQVLHPDRRSWRWSSPSSWSYRSSSPSPSCPSRSTPKHRPAEMLLTANYPGADAVTLEQSVRHAHRQQMSGVAHALHVSTARPAYRDESPGEPRHHHRSDIDQVLVNMRYSPAPPSCLKMSINQGVTVKKSV